MPLCHRSTFTRNDPFRLEGILVRSSGATMSAMKRAEIAEVAQALRALAEAVEADFEDDDDRPRESALFALTLRSQAVALEALV